MSKITVTRDEAKQEAIERMKIWGIFPETIRQFERSDYISKSEPPLGACFWLDETQLGRVKAFEEKHKAVVYHMIHSYTNFGEMESHLYVSEDPEEWDIDKDDIKHGRQLAYVYNCDMPDCSEIGYIGAGLTIAAGLERTF